MRRLTLDTLYSIPECMGRTNTRSSHRNLACWAVHTKMKLAIIVLTGLTRETFEPIKNRTIFGALKATSFIKVIVLVHPTTHTSVCGLIKYIGKPTLCTKLPVPEHSFSHTYALSFDRQRGPSHAKLAHSVFPIKVLIVWARQALLTIEDRLIRRTAYTSILNPREELTGSAVFALPCLLVEVSG